MGEGLREVDANLLLSLQALLEERNLTHAGARRAMTQSAMSGALARLRAHFGDELLVRSGRDFELTDLAVRLLPVVTEAVHAAEVVLGEERDFDPRSSRQFEVSTSEYAMTVLAEPLTRTLREVAPACSISFDALPSSREEFEATLARRDLVIGPIWFDLPGSRQPVFTDHLVCLVDRDHPRLKDGRLELADLLAIPHAVAEFGPAGAVRRPLEVVADESGLIGREVAVTVTSLLTLPYAIAGTDLCGFVPARLAERCLDVLGLTVARTPMPSVEIVEAAHWHPRRAAEPAGRWLRTLLHDVAVELESASEDTA